VEVEFAIDNMFLETFYVMHLDLLVLDLTRKGVA
jgi:hypothetical protein